jgi:HK97 family phage major capsid protein
MENTDMKTKKLMVAGAAVAALAIPAARGIQFVQAEAPTDPVALINAIKASFEAFKEANDKVLADLKKGQSDVVQNDKVDRINAEITTLNSKLVEVASQMSALQLSGSTNNEEQKLIAAFARERGQEISAQVYRDYRAGMDVYMRKGSAAPHAVMAAMSVGSDPDGGYAVTPDTSGRIVSKIYETSPVRQVANVVTIGTDAIEGFNDLGEGDAGWVAELGDRAETNTPQLGKWSIPVHEMYAMPKVTQKLLDDAMFDVEGWLAGKTADKFARTENTAYINGNGIGKPRGLLTYTTAATADSSRAWGTFEHVATGTSGGFGTAPNGSDKLTDLVFKLKAGYRNNANFMMARSTLAEVRKLKDGNGNYLWQPNFTERQNSMLLGFPVVEAEDFPVMAANSLSIGFGDIREAYTIVDRAGIRVLRDALTSKGFVKFYTTRRTGGGAVNFEAFKLLKFI